jgi:mono/diheme cytochrome c family protein
MNGPVLHLLWLASALLLAGCGSAESAVVVNADGPAVGPRKSALALPTDPGQRSYLKWCAPCHAPGVEHPGTNAIAAKYEGTRPGALIEQPDLDPELIKAMVRSGISVMPPFRKTELSDSELDALAIWLAAQGKQHK